MRKFYDSPEFDFVKVSITTNLLQEISVGEIGTGGGSIENPGEGMEEE